PSSATQRDELHKPGGKRRWGPHGEVSGVKQYCVSKVRRKTCWLLFCYPYNRKDGGRGNKPENIPTSILGHCRMEETPRTQIPRPLLTPGEVNHRPNNGRAKHRSYQKLGHDDRGHKSRYIKGVRKK
ncbi:unnamed protein product, partial [Ectocarpus sp. 8 AP-2014]